MTGPDLLALYAAATFTIGVLLNVVLSYAKREPVRTAAAAILVLLLLVSMLTGTPLAVLVGEVVGALGLLEKVRAAVAPMGSVLVHIDDVPPGAVPAMVPLHVAPAPDPDAMGDAVHPPTEG